MKPAQLAPGIYRIGANISNGDLFEGLWPIPHGVSLNSYVVKAQKTAIIDLVRDWDEAPVKLRDQLAEIPLDLKAIDYIVLNHLEPDHTGWLCAVREIAPNATIIATQRGIDLVAKFYGITDKVRAVKSGDTLDLGGTVLQFEEIPNVHWPETMVTFEPQSGVLFSCDAFGSYGSVGAAVFDDQLNEDEHRFFEAESLRYYANIVASFSVFVERAIKKLAGLPVKIIAPSHGIVWRKDPQRIISRYQRYAAYSAGPAEKEITLVWGSMYGNTERMVQVIAEAVLEAGIRLTIHQVPKEHMSWVLASCFKSTGLIFAMPTYEYRMFPPMAHVLDDLGRKKVHGKKVLRLGSFGWSGGAQKEFDEITAKFQWQCLPPVEFQGAPTTQDADRVREQVRELCRQVADTALPD